ncbi:uncharacterized protein MELLADRAFT_73497 [Melampsora larici-populina 98AG31]|uniref:Clathrin/coatomer adaptor adaptin-like N-terminal domain-containing protein n=1 Tax=Melampsora larici-populina (strain 98AG31 / pathotype 3-4-7) TaxID=747676 RepID=F4S8Y3_MELLP|nr:uncharacterized protein MELLADRAFT_73497 [Melampsora larici-populina 98AG31]EGF98910.1 hypothetical protein MELLADRAFT_73497 [Melampsora larici-populina 98AG31]
MRLMTRYAREHLQDPNRNQQSTKVSDPDLELLLNAVTPLFYSRNPSIIISATNVFLYVAPLTRLGSIVDPLMRLLSQSEVEQDEGNYLAVLHQIYQILISVPGQISGLFRQSLSDFFISCASDSRSVKLIKLKILTSFVSSGLEDQVKIIIKEFKFYVRDSDPVFVEEVTKSIGHLAMNTFGDGRIQAVKLLVQLTKESDCAPVNDLSSSLYDF